MVQLWNCDRAIALQFAIFGMLTVALDCAFLALGPSTHHIPDAPSNAGFEAWFLSKLDTAFKSCAPSALWGPGPCVWCVWSGPWALAFFLAAMGSEILALSHYVVPVGIFI